MPEVQGSPFPDLLERRPTFWHGLTQLPAGRTLHETRGLTAICAPETVKLSCCSNKLLLQVTIVCACGSEIYHNASQTCPAEPIGRNKEASEGAYVILDHARDGTVKNYELILTIILKVLVIQPSGFVMSYC